MPQPKPWNQEDFGIRLRTILHIRKLKHSQLARKLHVAPATVSRWQSNPANHPGLDQLEAAAKLLEVHVCWLAFGCAAHVPPEVDDLFSSSPSRPTIRRVMLASQPSRRFK